MKRIACLTLTGMIMALGLMPPGLMAHGEEEHSVPKKLPKREDTVSIKPSEQSGDRTPNHRYQSGDRERAEHDTPSETEISGDQTDTGTPGDLVHKQKRQVRSEVQEKSTLAIWKIGALAMVIGGLLIAYWPSGGRETS